MKCQLDAMHVNFNFSEYLPSPYQKEINPGYDSSERLKMDNRRNRPIRPKVSFPDLVLGLNGEIRYFVKTESYQELLINHTNNKPIGESRLPYFGAGSAFHTVHDSYRYSTINTGPCNITEKKLDNSERTHTPRFCDSKLTSSSYVQPSQVKDRIKEDQEDATAKPIWRGWESPESQKCSTEEIIHAPSETSTGCEPVCSTEILNPSSEASNSASSGDMNHSTSEPPESTQPPANSESVPDEKKDALTEPKANKKIRRSKKLLKYYECHEEPNSSGKLKIHIRVIGKKPYKCDACEESFASRNYLMKHRRIHFGNDRFVCKKCHISFYQNRYLKVHLTRAHSAKKRVSQANGK